MSVFLRAISFVLTLVLLFPVLRADISIDNPFVCSLTVLQISAQFSLNLWRDSSAYSLNMFCPSLL